MTDNLPEALDALGDALLQVDCYDVVEGDEVPQRDFWDVVFAAKKVLAANPIVEGRSCEAHDRRPCYTCSTHPAEPAPVEPQYTGRVIPPIEGLHDSEAEPAPAATDEAVDAALDVAMDDGHNGLDCRPTRDFGETMRAAVEAAVPLLGTRPLLDRREVEAAFIRAERNGVSLLDPWEARHLTDAVLELARPMPTRAQVREVLDNLTQLRDPQDDVDEYTEKIMALMEGGQS